jgi:predicted DNA-binding transcriptional regulator AlpA
MTNREKIQFLQVYQTRLRRWYKQKDKLVPADIPPEPKDPQPIDPEDETVARIAEEYGFDGSLYRDLTPFKNPFSVESIDHLKEQIETISKIIAEIENPPDRSAIDDNNELLTIPQIAKILNCGESVIRDRDRKGLLPTPVRIGGVIQWRKREILKWIDANCPNRQKWEMIKEDLK